jgi:hypothetical protein
MSEENPNEIVVKVKKEKEENNEVEKLQIEALKEENLELKEKLDLVATAEFEKRKKELGAGPEVDTPEKLEGFKLGQKSAQPKREPTGNAPLDSAQIYGSSDPFLKQKFDSPKEMVDAIKLRMQSDDPEVKAQARAIYEELLRKALIQGGTGKSEGIGLKEMIRKPKGRD